MTMKGLIAVAVWIILGMGIGEQLEVGTLIEGAFPFVWIGVFVIGVLAWKFLDID